ncbi:MAG: Gfo/Idh/MocA family protein [Oceanipulchritudo sp.]
MTNNLQNYRVALVGLSRIFKLHLRGVAETDGLELAGVCDLDRKLVEANAAPLGVPGFTDMGEMNTTLRPDIVVLATNTASHAPLTLLCAEAGVRAVVCEKPMAVHPKDAREMVRACEERGVLLVINHQRRMGDLAPVIEMLQEGIIGDLVELRGYCAGDFLSDGTHLVHSLTELAGRPEVQSVVAALDLEGGLAERYGHPVEAGAHVVLSCAGGLPVELSTGRFAFRHAYQEYHLTGTKGMLWRTGDKLAPNWFICDGGPGDRQVRVERDNWFPYPVATTQGGPWRALEGIPERSAIGEVYAALRDSLATGAEHPLSGSRTLPVQELITAAYLSGVRRAPVTLAEAGACERFPLENLPS